MLPAVGSDRRIIPDTPEREDLIGLTGDSGNSNDSSGSGGADANSNGGNSSSDSSAGDGGSTGSEKLPQTGQLNGRAVRRGNRIDTVSLWLHKIG